MQNEKRKAEEVLGSASLHCLDVPRGPRQTEDMEKVSLHGAYDSVKMIKCSCLVKGGKCHTFPCFSSSSSFADGCRRQRQNVNMGNEQEHILDYKFTCIILLLYRLRRC